MYSIYKNGDSKWRKHCKNSTIQYSQYGRYRRILLDNYVSSKKK